MDKKKPSKLFTPRWKLWLKRIKWVMFVSRPIPLFDRATCESCGVVRNKAIHKSCPLCGRGPDKVWVLVWQGQIQGIYRDPDDAKFDKRHIDAESDRKSSIEDWDLK